MYQSKKHSRFFKEEQQGRVVKEQRERQREERERREQLRLEAQQRREEDRQMRKALLSKHTRKGQPVLGARMEYLLYKLEQDIEHEKKSQQSSSAASGDAKQPGKRKKYDKKRYEDDDDDDNEDARGDGSDDGAIGGDEEQAGTSATAYRPGFRGPRPNMQRHTGPAWKRAPFVNRRSNFNEYRSAAGQKRPHHFAKRGKR